MNTGSRRMSTHTRQTVLAVVSLLFRLAGGISTAHAQPAGNDETGQARETLRGAITRSGKIEEALYEGTGWTALRFAMNDAREIADRADATSRELTQAAAELEQRIAALVKRPPPPDPGFRVGLSASLFATDRAGPANNVSLLWAASEPCDSVELGRAADRNGPYETVYTGTGASFHDYDVPLGTRFYKLTARRGAEAIVSNIEEVAATPIPPGIDEYSNETESRNGFPGQPLKVGDTHYRFAFEREGKGLKHVLVQTSLDGETWQDGPVVLTSDAHPDLDDFKFESGSRFYDPRSGRIVWWAHWERSGPSYGHGRAFVASAKPGEPFTVHRIFNPLGIQVRDMSVFVDEDGRGYLAAASNVPGQGANATLYIFTLNRDYTDVTGIASKAMEGGYREAPHIIRKGDFYYLFFSQASGWYPSRGGYVSAPSPEGPWSAPRTIGNSSTFSAQSGGIIEYGAGAVHVPVMMANRWIRGDGTSRNVVLPIRLAEGFAFYDYAPYLLHAPADGRILPLHEGRLLSANRPVSSSIPGEPQHEADKAFDGDYDSFFRSDRKEWPFTVATDLGGLREVRNVQVSWYIHKGSEAYYTYAVEGSLDGREWYVMLDRTNPNDSVVSRTYGFTSDILPTPSRARHVRLRVHGAVLHNNPNNWYSPTVYEIRIFGDDAPDAEPDTPLGVIGTVPRGATVVKQYPGPDTLGRTVRVVTANGEHVDAEVDWDFSANRFDTPYSVEEVTGTVRGTPLRVRAHVEVIPENLVYFIDTGCGEETAPYDAVKKAARLLNDRPERAFDANAAWGHEGTPKIKSTVGLDATDKFATGMYGNPLTYVVALTQAGTYTVTLGATDWWGDNKEATVVARFRGADGSEREILIAEKMIRNKGRVTRVEKTLTLDAPTQLRIVGTGDPAFSFIGIARK